ncbi:MAG: hypothetical protein M1524_03890 [Patescibacteria group bacterium]|nr:hypothetical protein [Patescibacteria group bacterium]
MNLMKGVPLQLTVAIACVGIGLLIMGVLVENNPLAVVGIVVIFVIAAFLFIFHDFPRR